MYKFGLDLRITLVNREARIIVIKVTDIVELLKIQVLRDERGHAETKQNKLTVTGWKFIETQRKAKRDV